LMMAITIFIGFTFGFAGPRVATAPADRRPVRAQPDSSSVPVRALPA